MPLVLESQEIPLEDVIMVPFSPTEINISFAVDELSFEFEEVLESESFFAHDIIKVINTMTQINEKIFLFIKTYLGNYEIVILNQSQKNHQVTP